MLRTELHQSDVPDVFAEFQKLIGQESWLTRAHELRCVLVSAPHRKDEIVRENFLALQLDRCSSVAAQNGGTLREVDCSGEELIDAFTLSSQALDLYRLAEKNTKRAAKTLVKRIQGGFNNPVDLRAMQLESRVATHFSLRGYTVTFPELEGG